MSHVQVELRASSKIEEATQNNSSTCTTESTHCWGLCCNALVDTDDIILQQEREKAAEYTTENPLLWWVKVLLEVILGVPGFKKPSGCNCCCENKSVRCIADILLWCGWVSYQLFLLFCFLFFVSQDLYGTLICPSTSSEESFGDSLTDTSELVRRAKMYRCPYAQALLLNATGTGVQAEIAALSKDPSFEEYWIRETKSSGVDNPIAQYLEWKGETKSVLPSLFSAAAHTVVVMVIAAIFLSFSLKFQIDDPVEILFPAVLKKKKILTHQAHPPNQEIASKYHLVRMWRPVMEVGGACMLSGYLLFFFTDFADFADWKQVLRSAVFLLFPGLLFLIGVLICGVIVQIHNGTVLANVLIEEIIKPHQVDQFGEWMEIYKTVVGGLHIWSWRSTWCIGGVLAWFLFEIMANIVDVVFLYSTFMDPKIVKLSEVERFGFFIKTATNEFQSAILLSILSAVILFLLAMVSVRYKRLRVLVATVRLEDKCRLDDFEILQSDHAAYTLFDVPVTMRIVATVVNLVVLQVGLLAFAAA